MNLILRFDEFGAFHPLQMRVPGFPQVVSAKNLDGIGNVRSATKLQAQLDPSAPAGVTRYVVASGGNVSTGGPQDQTSSVDPYTFTVTTIPKQGSWTQDGTKEATKLDATIKYVDCPIDPRVIRSAAVEFYLGCVTEDDYASQVEGTFSETSVVLPTQFTGPGGEPRTNLRFQGFVNKWETDWGEGEPTIRLECQDNSVLLHQQSQPPRLCIDMTKPLDKAIADYMTNFVQFAGLSVEYRPSTDPVPVLGPSLGPSAFRPNLGPPISKAGGASDKGPSCWDYLTEVCAAIGHNIRMDGTTLIIQRTRSLLVGVPGSPAGRPDDPFVGRNVDNVQFSYRRFLYGRNIKTLKVARNFTRGLPKNIELRCYDVTTKKALVARFPQVADRQVYALPGNATDQKWEVRRCSGITDLKVLTGMAQDYYESQGRQELSVELTTMNMGSFGGSNLDPDVLDMKVGDTFELLVNRDPDDVNDLTRIETALTAQGQNSALMLQLGFSQAFADAYAAAYTNANFLTTYKLKTLKIDWGEDGVKLSVGGINYIEVRANVQLPPGQETTASPLQPAVQPTDPPVGSGVT
jgi:hypothetical protein